MDKYEYKIRSEEIKQLIAQGEYLEAAVIADSIDWRRVKSVMMLCTISDLYKINRRFEDSRDMLLLAYDRHPGGRSIVYSLCELSIKMEEFVQAVEYYKEFVQVAPKDSGRYVLQYKLYEAQDVSLEERIAVLEELKAKDYTEKWAYELAYLYHRVGLATRCVEECDELILWFGEGKYVIKAMELKMLHEPLSLQNQAKYNEYKGIKSNEKTRAIASFKEVAKNNFIQEAPTMEIPSQDIDIQVKLMGVGQYDTINMQEELAQNMKELWEGTEAIQEVLPEEILDSEDDMDIVTKTILAPMLNDTISFDAPDEEEINCEVAKPEEEKVEEVFFSETSDLDNTASQILEAMKEETLAEKEEPEDRELENSKFDKILGMEYDGQISLLIPEAELIEKQITGQIKLDDVLAEWEKMKKESEQKRMEAVRQRVLEQTGAMFTEFEASIRDGLLEKLESNKATQNIEIEIEETLEAEEVLETEEVLEVEPEETEDIEEVLEESEETEEELEEEEEVVEEPESEEEEEPINVSAKKARSLSADEKELFGAYIQNANTKLQITHALDSISLASYTGNVILTGDEGMDILTLAKNLVKEIQSTDRNFSGKIAKITGESLDKKDIEQTLTKLSNGALIVQGISAIGKETIEDLHKFLEAEGRGIVILLLDTKKNMNKFLSEYHILNDRFNIRIDVEALDDDSLVEYGKKYALEQEYSIDEMGVLALHTRISDMQTLDHAVTVAEVREMIDDAIYQANRKNFGHFIDILVAKRYDEDDMIILREKDFI